MTESRMSFAPGPRRNDSPDVLRNLTRIMVVEGVSHLKRGKALAVQVADNRRAVQVKCEGIVATNSLRDADKGIQIIGFPIGKCPDDFLNSYVLRRIVNHLHRVGSVGVTRRLKQILYLDSHAVPSSMNNPEEHSKRTECSDQSDYQDGRLQIHTTIIADRRCKNVRSVLRSDGHA